MASRCGICSRYFEVIATSASIHCFTCGASRSSIQRQGLAILFPA